MGNVLLHEQHGFALFVNPFDDLHYLYPQVGLEAQGGLVDAEKIGMAHEAPGDGQHTGFPPTHGFSHLLFPIGKAWEEIEHPLQIFFFVDPGPAGVRPELEVFQDRHLRKEFPRLSDVGHPFVHQGLGRAACNFNVPVAHRALHVIHKPADGLQEGALPVSIRSHHEHQLAVFNGDGHPVQDMKLVIPGMKIIHMQHNYPPNNIRSLRDPGSPLWAAPRRCAFRFR